MDSSNPDRESLCTHIKVDINFIEILSVTFVMIFFTEDSTIYRLWHSVAIHAYLDTRYLYM